MEKSKMKRIKELTVTCKYTVSLSDIDVPDEVYDGLMNGHTFDSELSMSDKESRAMDWMASKISESDAHSWEYDIDNIE